MAATRGQKIRMERHEELRKKFKGVEYIRQLDELGKDLKNLDDDVKKAKASKKIEKDGKGNKTITLTSPDIVLEKAKVRQKIIQSRIDLNIRRLKKILPDEIEILHSDGEGTPLENFANALKAAIDNGSKN
jgi:hypothetical protein